MLRRILTLAAAAALLTCSPSAHADLIKQSSTYTRTVLMTSTGDHITGATGLTLTVTESKAGAAFASISPTVTELAGGRYAITLTTTNTNTIGALDLQITATGADPSDSHDQVVGFDPTSDLGAAALATANTGITTANSGITALPSASANAAAVKSGSAPSWYVAATDPWATVITGYSAGTAGALLGALTPSSIATAVGNLTVDGTINLKQSQAVLLALGIGVRSDAAVNMSAHTQSVLYKRQDGTTTAVTNTVTYGTNNTTTTGRTPTIGTLP